MRQSGAEAAEGLVGVTGHQERRWLSAGVLVAWKSVPQSGR